MKHLWRGSVLSLSLAMFFKSVSGLPAITTPIQQHTTSTSPRMRLPAVSTKSTTTQIPLITSVPGNKAAVVNNDFTTVISGSTITSHCSAGVTTVSYTFETCSITTNADHQTSFACMKSASTDRQCVETLSVPENHWLSDSTVTATSTSTTVNQGRTSTATITSTSTLKGTLSATATATAKGDGSISLPLSNDQRIDIARLAQSVCPDGTGPKGGFSAPCRAWNSQEYSEYHDGLIQIKNLGIYNSDMLDGQLNVPSWMADNDTAMGNLQWLNIQDVTANIIAEGKEIPEVLDVPADTVAKNAQVIHDIIESGNGDTPTTASESSGVMEARTLVPVCVLSSQPPMASENVHILTEWMQKVLKPYTSVTTPTPVQSVIPDGVTFISRSTATVPVSTAICHTSDPSTRGYVFHASVTSAAAAFYSDMSSSQVAVSSVGTDSGTYYWHNFNQGGKTGVRYRLFDDLRSSDDYAVALSVQYLPDACSSSSKFEYPNVNFTEWKKDDFVSMFAGPNFRDCYGLTPDADMTGGNTYSEQCIQFQLKVSNEKPAQGGNGVTTSMPQTTTTYQPDPTGVTFISNSAPPITQSTATCHTNDELKRGFVASSAVASAASDFYSSLTSSGVSATPTPGGINFHNWEDKNSKGEEMQGVRIHMPGNLIGTFKNYYVALSVQYLPGACGSSQDVNFAQWTVDDFVSMFAGENFKAQGCYKDVDLQGQKSKMIGTSGNTYNADCVQAQVKISDDTPMNHEDN